jgi:hypothetical protein
MRTLVGNLRTLVGGGGAERTAYFNGLADLSRVLLRENQIDKGE